MRSWIRRHPLTAFWAITFTLSWSVWIPQALTGGRGSHFPGLLGPAAGAAVVTALTQGRRGVFELATRMFRWRIDPRWLLTLLVPLLAAGVALAGLALTGGDVPGLNELSHVRGLPRVGWAGVFVLMLAIDGLGEETGWRGFAWERIRPGRSLLGAGLLLAVPWTLWHLPLFWIDSGFAGLAPLMIPGLFVGMASGAVVLGWIYENANSSILLVALWHSTLNMVSGTTGSEGAIAGVVSGVVIAWAIILSRHTPRRTILREAGPDQTRSRASMISVP